MRMIGTMLGCLLFLASAVVAKDAVLSNFTYTLSDHDGWAIFRKDGTGSYVEKIRVPKTQASYTDANVPPNVQLCYQVKAYNQFGLEQAQEEKCGITGNVPQGVTSWSLTFQ